MIYILNKLVPSLSSFGHDDEGPTIRAMVVGTLFRVSVMLAFALLFVGLATVGVISNHHASIGFALGILVGLLTRIAQAYLTGSVDDRIYQQLPAEIFDSVDLPGTVSNDPIEDKIVLQPQTVLQRTQKLGDAIAHQFKTDPTAVKRKLEIEVEKLRKLGVVIEEGKKESSITLPQNWAHQTSLNKASNGLVKLVGYLVACRRRAVTIVLSDATAFDKYYTELLQALKVMYDRVAEKLRRNVKPFVVSIDPRLTNWLSNIGFVPETRFAGHGFSLWQMLWPR